MTYTDDKINLKAYVPKETYSKFKKELKDDYRSVNQFINKCIADYIKSKSK